MSPLSWRWPLGLTLLALALAAWLLLRPAADVPPDIQGAILAVPKPLPEVGLVDHHGNRVSPRDFDDGWLLVSYGFTHCPDICPTLLSELAKFRQLLDERPRFQDLQVVFYSIDPARDSVEQLASYVPWFDKRFLGLRASDPSMGRRFEKSLGMSAFVLPADGAEPAQVAHGFRLYLIDDKARLRASLAPSADRDGRQYYEPERLLKDYLALRRWSAG